MALYDTMDAHLDHLTFLALDCQASGANPQKHQLLEIGWLVFSLDEGQTPDRLKPQVRLIRPPQGFTLPRPISRLTGIDRSDFENAVSEVEALNDLLKQAKAVARRDNMRQCPTVIHFARFEMRFLQHVHQSIFGTKDLPLEVFCTHQMAARLMPQLPRKGLRAVAGNLGFSMPVHKRCGPHLQATAWVWHHLVRMVMNGEGVQRLDQLRHWRQQDQKPIAPREYPMPSHLRSALPHTPGVYRMKRSNGDVLYIGKATSLKQRVNSYFHKSRRHSEHTLEMLSQAVDLDTTPMPTALEAALLEADEIKQYRPPYNIALAQNHRQIRYLSRNFKNHSPKQDTAHPLGPVPWVDPFLATHTLAHLLDQPSPDTDCISQVMALPPDMGPERATFASGLALFKAKHAPAFRQRALGPAVLHIGRLSWLEKIKEPQASQAPMDKGRTETPEKEISVDFVWTPEAVTRSLESLCRKCGFLIRRARWFRILSNCVVAWQIKNDTMDGINVLVMKEGLISKRLCSHRSTPLPEPFVERSVDPSYRSPIDLDTYDRLRVLTTELRRLIADRRFHCIKLSPRNFLHDHQLRQLLRWV